MRDSRAHLKLFRAFRLSADQARNEGEAPRFTSRSTMRGRHNGPVLVVGILKASRYLYGMFERAQLSLFAHGVIPAVIELSARRIGCIYGEAAVNLKCNIGWLTASINDLASRYVRSLKI